MINIAVEYVECSVVVADINVAVCPDVAWFVGNILLQMPAGFLFLYAVDSAVDAQVAVLLALVHEGLHGVVQSEHEVCVVDR